MKDQRLDIVTLASGVEGEASTSAEHFPIYTNI